MLRVYIFASSKGVAREEVFRRMEMSMRGAMAFYGKQHCMVVVDRNGGVYEVAVTRPDLAYVPTAAEVQHGKQAFGRLRTASVVVNGY